MDRPTLDTPVTRTDRPGGPRDTPPARPDDVDRYTTHLLTILSVSAGMVGVCLTAIGLIGVMKMLQRMEILVDDVLAVSALIFMAASVMSFVGLRSEFSKRWRHFERTLDTIFCVGLVLMAVATLLLTWVVL